jgi:hypothetical protein
MMSEVYVMPHIHTTKPSTTCCFVSTKTSFLLWIGFHTGNTVTVSDRSIKMDGPEFWLNKIKFDFLYYSSPIIKLWPTVDPDPKNFLT